MTPQQAWIRAFVKLFLEVESGRRPARHLRPLVHADVYPTVSATRDAPTTDIVRIMTQTRGDVCESVVLLGTGARLGALALSIRRYDGRWQVTEVCRPERAERIAPAAPEELQFVQPSGLHHPTRTVVPEWRVPSGWREPARAA